MRHKLEHGLDARNLALVALDLVLHCVVIGHLLQQVLRLLKRLVGRINLLGAVICGWGKR